MKAAMKGTLSVTFCGLFLSACATTHPHANPISPMVEEPATVADLAGIWNVSLYFDPSQPPSSTVLEIISVGEDGSLEGSFYNSPFTAGRAIIDQSQLVISVTTEDNSGVYATSGRLLPDGRLRGQTLSVGRDFLMPWSASRE